MKRTIIFPAVLWALAGYAAAQGNVPPITFEDFSAHLMHYFENKGDSIIHETISIYENNSYAEMLDQADNILLFFFYGIKADDISRYNAFKDTVNRRKSRRLMALFDAIESNDIGAFLEQQEPNPELNDIYWTLFFSSGNVTYLNYLLTVINNYHNEAKNITYYLAARSAMWSMALNIITYPRVREHFTQSSINNKTIKAYILNTNPDKIQSETVAFIRRQREKGIW